MHRLGLLKFLVKRPQPQRQNIAGFTLVEVLVVVIIIGILSAVAVPGWLGFVAKQRLNATQNNVFDAFRRVQSNAKRDKVPWQITFRNTYDGSGALISQWAIHPASSLSTSIGLVTAAQLNALTWQNFETGIRIRGFPNTYSLVNTQTPTCPTSTAKACTTFDSGTTASSIEIYRSIFDSKGQPSRGLTDQGKVTMSPTKPDGTIDPNSVKSCVIISTLLGAARTAQDTDCDG